MKQFILAILFVFICMLSSAQAIRITVNEKFGDEIKPLANVKFELTFNDTIKTEMTSTSEGSLGKFDLEKGVYKVVLSNPVYVISETKNVIIEAKRTNNLVVTCVRKSIPVPEVKKPIKKK